MIEVGGKTIVAIDMDTDGERVTKSGIFLPKEGFNEQAIHPRWCKVYKVGPEVDLVSENQWLYVEHGRWTHAIDVKDENGEPLKVWVIDPEGIMVVSDDKPE